MKLGQQPRRGADTRCVGSPCIQPRERIHVHGRSRAPPPTPAKLSPSLSVLSNRLLPASRWIGTSLQDTSHSRLLPRRQPLPTLTHLLHGGEWRSPSPRPVSSTHLHFVLTLYTLSVFSFSLEILWNMLKQ